jgi:hypothetical protein
VNRISRYGTVIEMGLSHVIAGVIKVRGKFKVVPLLDYA